MFYSEVWQRGVRVGGAAQVVRQWSVMLDALSENAYMAGALLSAPPASAGLCHLACCERSFPTAAPGPAPGQHAGPIGLLCSRLVSGFMATPVLSLIDGHADSGHVSSALASDGAKAAPT